MTFQNAQNCKFHTFKLENIHIFDAGKIHQNWNLRPSKWQKVLTGLFYISDSNLRLSNNLKELRSFQLDLFLMRWLIKEFYLAACVASKYPVKLYVVVALKLTQGGGRAGSGDANHSAAGPVGECGS